MHMILNIRCLRATIYFFNHVFSLSLSQCLILLCFHKYIHTLDVSLYILRVYSVFWFGVGGGVMEYSIPNCSTYHLYLYKDNSL
jgi:hypothetical protein